MPASLPTELRPRARVRCRSAADVVAALAFARTEALPLAVRAGGHCFAGRSSTEGVLIDLGPRDAVALDGDVAVIGAGARLGRVYAQLAEHGRALAGGCGPDVGVAGLALGGGLGVLGRTYGLTCDQLEGAEVVLADGRVVDCDEARHPDLLWALRGAGGGQFGVVTTLRLRTVPLREATAFDLRWPGEHAAGLIAAWQDWSPGAPDALAASLLVVAPPGRPPAAHVFGTMLAPEAATRDELRAFAARMAAGPEAARIEVLPYHRAKAHLAAHAPGEGAPDDAVQRSKSEFFRARVPEPAIGSLVEHLAAGPGHRVLDFSPWGGAYGRRPVAATAFAHREERFLLKQDIAVAPEEAAAGRAWLERSWAIVHPYGSGGVYPNFPDPELDDPLRAYHGPNLERLMAVKAAYDPGAVFRFPQSVPPAA